MHFDHGCKSLICGKCIAFARKKVSSSSPCKVIYYDQEISEPIVNFSVIRNPISIWTN